MPNRIRTFSLGFAVVLAGAACNRAPARDTAPPPPEQQPAQRKTAEAVEMTAPADAERTESGLAFKVLKPGGGGPRPTLEDKVVVDFKAYKGDGSVSDSSEKRGGPQTFDMTGVIAGWTEALLQMHAGEARRLWIPDDLVYPGRPGYPRPAAVFDVELVAIQEGMPPQPAPSDVAAAPSDAIRTKSGLAYKLLEKSGSADKPNAWDRVTINFTGWTSDGTMFESTLPQKRPSIYDLDDVIAGWREAFQLMATGDRARLWIPEALAYHGRTGMPEGDLVYDVELVAVDHEPEPPRPPANLTAPPRDARKTASGLAYRVLRKGTGTEQPTAQDHVTVNYSAWTTDGTLVDSTVAKGQPVTVPIGRVIPGWAEGLQRMVTGEKTVFWIPENLAYAGREGSPKGMLVYEVELLEILHRP